MTVTDSDRIFSLWGAADPTEFIAPTYLPVLIGVPGQTEALLGCGMLDKPLTLPSEHNFSLSLCEECMALDGNPPVGVLGCRVLGAGLVELLLQAGTVPGFGAKAWRLHVGGEGVGDQASLAAMLGTAARSPVAVRFDEPITMVGVDDTGMVDEAFWLGGLDAAPTLRAIALRAVAWLEGSHLAADAEAQRIAWAEAQEHTAKRQTVIETFRGIATCTSLVGADEADAWLRPEWLVPSFQSVARREATVGEWEGACAHAVASGAVEEVEAGVFAFDLFSEELCDLLASEVDAFEATSLPRRRPNSMNNYGLVVNDIGMHGLLSRMLSTLISPLARILYPGEAVAAALDHHHSFVVAYDAESAKGDVSLDLHHDASEVTLNVCLGRDGFVGGDLRFCGRFGSPTHRRSLGVVRHRKGRAVLHLGRQRHGAEALEAGARLNLIVWARSSAFRAAAAFGHIDPDGYPKQPEASGAPPDTVCLSKANDDDYVEQLAQLGEGEAERLAKRRRV